MGVVGTALTEPEQRPGIRRALIAALAGGLAAGTVDVFAASLIYHAPPDVILRAIASGLLGKASFQGGWESAAIGLGSQWLISVCAAAVYVAAATRFPVLLQHALRFGPPFGAGVFIVMHTVVVPLSKANPALPHPLPLAEDFAANMLFGLIIALAAKKLLYRESAAQSAGAAYKRPR
jgi:uncharacterized membrane protein YagU involved in acid resistance